MELIGCPKTSVRNYHYSLHNNPEERSSHQICSESLKSYKILKNQTLGSQNIKGAFVLAEEARCPCAHHKGM
jgi:hypothetical protein